MSFSEPIPRNEPGKNEEKENPAASVEEVRQQICIEIKKDPSLIPRLKSYAINTIHFYSNRYGIKGIEASDCEQELFLRLLTCRRRWNKRKYPDFEIFLKLGIKSLIRNELQRRQNTREVYLPGSAEDENGEEGIETIAPAGKKEEALDNIIFEETFENLKKRLRDDKLGLDILEEKRNGENSNIEMAKKLGVSVKDIVNALKRIRFMVNKMGKRL